MDVLEKSREYEKTARLGDVSRPHFHVTPPIGWMNDPNGFSVFGGRIHLFYQYHPYSTEWGPMHWGHQVTDDMIKWEHLPVALVPDEEYDTDGCFSGSAIVTGIDEADEKQSHVLFYTGVSKDNSGAVRQNQCIAVGDGRNYRKLQANPVVNGESLPDNLSRSDFRDPKVWREGDRLYMLAGGVDDAGRGLVVLYECSDTDVLSGRWKYTGILARNSGDLGGVWECPDFFELGGKRVLMVSPTGMTARGCEFHNGNNSVYMLGELDRDSMTFVGDGGVFSVDYGTDFYAPQTTLLPDGRRIMIAWMDSWHNLYIPDGQEWQGMMTLPRELTVKDGRMLQSPVREIDKYRGDRISYEDVPISAEDGCVSRELPGVSGRLMDMTVRVKGGCYREFTVEVAKDAKHYTRFTYDKAKRILEMDRTYSGMKKDCVCIRRAFVPEADDGVDIEMRFIMDTQSVELFVNGGRMTMSTVIYTGLEADGVAFGCDGTALVDVEMYTLAR